MVKTCINYRLHLCIQFGGIKFHLFIDTYLSGVGTALFSNNYSEYMCSIYQKSTMVNNKWNKTCINYFLHLCKQFEGIKLYIFIDTYLSGVGTALFSNN